MTPREYCIWLQGYLEAAGNNLSGAQVETIKNRLNNIFEHVAEQPQTQTPGYLGTINPFEHGAIKSSGVDPSKTIYRC